MKFEYIEKETKIIDKLTLIEELSGWKAQKVEDEIRFFPPSNVAK